MPLWRNGFPITTRKLGGSSLIPYGRQEILQSDVDEVISVLHSDFITQGPQVPLFEQTVADKVGAKYAVAVNSATSALHLACRALGVQAGDIVWTSPITFVASANCALYCGASIDFVDIDESTCNMSVSALELKLKDAERLGKLPKVIIPVHFGGQSCDMARIRKLSNDYGFAVIEDASHAIGGRYKDSFVGGCVYSDITIFSFHPVKIITTGEGGMALSNDDVLATKMRMLSSHGITRDPEQMDREQDGPWYYQQIDLGYNYRMTEIQAALGISQIQRLDDYVSKRNQIASTYDKAFRGSAIKPLIILDDRYSAYHLYVVRVSGEHRQGLRRLVFEQLREKGIGVNVHYIPVHLQPWYKHLGFKEGMFPVAENYYKEALSLPMFPTLSVDEQQYVVNTALDIVTKAVRGDS